MKATRRGFLRGCMVGMATVAVGIRLAHAGPVIQGGPSYTWKAANDRYDFGIDKQHPWDVVIYDKWVKEPITTRELTNRGNVHATMPHYENYLTSDTLDSYTLRARKNASLNGGANAEGDAIDLAFEAMSIVAITQGFIGWKEAGNPGFDGPWKELSDEIDEPRIITTNAAWAAEMERSAAC